jgi:hypothetical protein
LVIIRDKILQFNCHSLNYTTNSNRNGKQTKDGSDYDYQQ